MPGFIHDKLEIKFLILYITARVIEPIPFDTVWDLAMCDEGVDYFSLTEAVGHMVETGQLERDQEQRYSITEKGRRNSEICESSLPYSVRLRTDRNIEEYNKELLRQAQVQGKAIPRENGTYTVELKLSDDVDSLMQLELMVATEEMAKDLAERFRKDPEHLYARVLEALYEEQK